ncbi:olfactory receptor 10A5-like [Protobothrops mucrosquamatus]|uniref:olfactory receptor 10A5-like n=1 Tax=Protobothrops mucrosquamatus TaxID=103944 RepID=UPI0010FB2FE3|nr:olfactory receptor 10A5-like [Protobothrops mucrosquamatus]
MLHNSTMPINFILLGLSDESYLQSIFFFTFLGIYMITLSGNLIIILLTLADATLHKPMYFFLRNLAFLEICFTSVTIPKMLDNIHSGNKSISFIGCAAQTYFSFFLGGTECFLLASMAYDRYVAICKPLYYPILIDQRVYTSLALASWLSGFFMSFGLTSMVFRLSFCDSNVINHFFCDIPPLLKLACGNIFMTEIAVFAVAVIYVTLPFLLILLSYYGIIIAILKISSSEGRKKTFSTCSSHLIVVTLFYGSSSIMYLKPNSTYFPNTDKYLSLFYTFISPILNPIIYSLRNQEVKGAFLRIWEKKVFG